MAGSENQRQHDEQDARGRLLREAGLLFMAQGFAAVSTRQICAAAGVTQPTLYHHFGNKENLYLAVVLQHFSGLDQGIQAAIAEGQDLPERLHRIALIFWTGSVGEYQAMQRDAMAHMPAEHRAIVGKTVRAILLDPLVSLMQAAVATGELPPQADAVVLTQLFWGLVDGVSGIYRRGDAMPAPSDNRSTIAFFLAGARGLGPADYQVWPAMGSVDQLFRARPGAGPPRDLVL